MSTSIRSAESEHLTTGWEPGLRPYGSALLGHPPLMVRLPSPQPASPGPEVDVREVRDTVGLALAERVLVEGYPMPELEPLWPGLLTTYSNRSDLLHELGEATCQLERASQAEPDRLSVRSVRSPNRKGRVWGLTERLSEDDVYKIAMSYEAGELRRDIAARYKISVRSVGRLLRKWRAERDEVA